MWPDSGLRRSPFQYIESDMSDSQGMLHALASGGTDTRVARHSPPRYHNQFEATSATATSQRDIVGES